MTNALVESLDKLLRQDMERRVKEAAAREAALALQKRVDDALAYLDLDG